MRFKAKEPTDFFRELKKRVNSYFKENDISKNSNPRMVVKTIAMLSFYLVPLGVILFGGFPFWVAMVMYLIMGIGISGIGFSVMHDANHGAYSKNKWVNRILGLSLNAIGGSAFTWKVQHNMLHHTFTNIYGIDEDIHDKPILRLSPHGKKTGIHRFQHIYAIILYGFATVSWVLFKDFKQLAIYNKVGYTQKIGYEKTRAIFGVILTKVLYIAYMVVLPLLVTDYLWWQLLVGILAMHFVAGVVITTIFQLAHVVEDAHHPLPNKTGDIENDWAIHQMYTTANFARNNKLVSWFVGGLNFQVEHHLFPMICHVHYKKIAPIVKQTAEEYGVPYFEAETLGQAIRSHIKTLKEFGSGHHHHHAA